MREAELGLQVAPGAGSLRESGQQSGSSLSSPTDPPGPCGPSRRSAGAARSPSGPRVSRRNRRSGRCRRRPRARRRRWPRWLMVIFVCATARLPFRSTLEPPRKCRMLTPLSKPALLTSMNSAAGPWNQVAVIQPSSCHTVREALPVAGVAPQRPVLHDLDDRGFVVHQSTFIPVSLTSFDHFCTSSRRNLPNSSIAMPIGTAPCLPQFSFTSGALMILTISAFSSFEHRPRRARGRHQAEPDGGLVARHAGLGDGRHLRRHRGARLAGGGERLQLAAARVRRRWC